MQVLLVTGGYNGNTLDSTELLLPSATSWSYSGALPSPRQYLRGATLDNKVVITGTNSDTLIIMRHNLFYKHCNSLHIAGGYYYDYYTYTPTHYDDVLEYDEEMQEWKKIGSMSIKRVNHAITVVNYDSIKEYCN